MAQFCECGSILDKGKCTNRHCGDKASRIWIIDGIERRFTEPVTLREAKELAKKMPKPQPKEEKYPADGLKPWMPYET